MNHDFVNDFVLFHFFHYDTIIVRNFNLFRGFDWWNSWVEVVVVVAVALVVVVVVVRINFNIFGIKHTIFKNLKIRF